MSKVNSAFDQQIQRDIMAFCINTSNSSSPFSIARLYPLSFAPPISLCDNHATRNHTHLKPGLVKVPYVTILNTIFGFHVYDTLEPSFKKLRIFALGLLVVIRTRKIGRA